MPYFDYWYVILVIPAMILSMIASASVKSTYAKYAKIASRRGMTGSQIAYEILRRAGINEVSIGRVGGQLSDHYSPKEKIIRLSEGVYDGSSVASLGVAAHEAGHVLQYYGNYFPIRIRNSILPVVNFGSSLSMPLVILGLILGVGILVDVGIVLFAVVVCVT